MRITKNHISGSFLIHHDSFRDDRGEFFESYNQEKFSSLGIDHKFVQDNMSFSHARALRGLHIQSRNPQGKLISVLNGEIFDVIVDLRKDSPSFKNWLMINLKEHSRKSLYVPEGCAHGFYSVSDSVVHYKCTTLYDKESDGGIFALDQSLGIEWPSKNNLLISGKDMRLPSMDEWLELQYGR